MDALLSYYKPVVLFLQRHFLEPVSPVLSCVPSQQGVDKCPKAMFCLPTAVPCVRSQGPEDAAPGFSSRGLICEQKPAMSEITHKQHLMGWQDGSPHSQVNTLGLSWSRKVRGLCNANTWLLSPQPPWDTLSPAPTLLRVPLTTRPLMDLTSNGPCPVDV